MPRIACLHVPDFPLAALLRAEPELVGRAVAVAERLDPAAPLVAISPEAARAGIRPGLSTAQGRTIVADLEVRIGAGERLAAAAEALADVAASFSPRVESNGTGTVWLDADGLETLCGDETHLATLLAARSGRVGLGGAEVGIGASRAVARLAARGGLGVVPAGEERALLAPLPVALLLSPPHPALRAQAGSPDAPPIRSGRLASERTTCVRILSPKGRGEADLAATLTRWGITTLGALAALPADAVATRLGEQGLRLIRLARGEDDDPLVPQHRPLRFEESVDCEWAIDTFEPLSFLLRAALERLTSRLDLRGFRAGDLELSLRLANRAHETRRIAVAAPTNEVKSLLALVRTVFETHPPAAAIEAFRLSAVAEHLRAVELDLFRPPGPLPEELATTLARLAAIAGTERVGRAVTIDSHRPEAFALEPFVREMGSDPFSTKVARANGNGHRSVLALRAFRPPLAIEVVCDRGRPDFVRTIHPLPRFARPSGGRSMRNGEATAAIQGRVVDCAGPWRTSAEWWGRPLARDDYDLELTDGGIYRVYREHATNRWFAAGTYD